MRQNQTHFHFVWLGRSFGGMSATWLVTITADEALLDTSIPKTKGETPFDCKRMTYGGFKILVEA